MKTTTKVLLIFSPLGYGSKRGPRQSAFHRPLPMVVANTAMNNINKKISAFDLESWGITNFILIKKLWGAL